MYKVTHRTAPLYLVELLSTRVYVLRHAATIMFPLLTGVLLLVPFLSLPLLFGIVCLAIYP